MGFWNYVVCLSATDSKFLDAVIVSFNNKYAALPIDDDAYRIAQLTVRTAFRSPLGHKHSIRIKFLDSVIGGISHIDIVNLYDATSTEKAVEIAKRRTGSLKAYLFDLPPSIKRIISIPLTLRTNIRTSPNFNL